MNYYIAPLGKPPASAIRVISCERKHLRANHASRQIFMQLKSYITTASLISLVDPTGSEVSSGFGNEFIDEEIY